MHLKRNEGREGIREEKRKKLKDKKKEVTNIFQCLLRKLPLLIRFMKHLNKSSSFVKVYLHLFYLHTIVEQIYCRI